LTQPVTHLPEQPQQPELHSPSPKGTALYTGPSRSSIVSLLVLVGLLFLLFTGMLLHSLPQVLQPAMAQDDQSALQKQDSSTPLTVPGSNTAPLLHLSPGNSVIYEMQNSIYIVPAMGGTSLSLLTPGYIYNPAVPPLLTPTNQLLYSGDGLWLTDLASDSPKQLTTMPSGQIITSMVLSDDGTTVAWSTEPVNGEGITSLYITSLSTLTSPHTSLVYQQAATDCPCFRAFAFLEEPGVLPHSLLLLTDDGGDHNAIRSGLWLLDMNEMPPDDPQQLLSEDAQQGPLGMLPHSTTLLYSSSEGVVPPPTDGSVPADLTALNYANSLAIATIDSHTYALSTPLVILPAQSNLSNTADYHWVSTPVFSPDGHTLAYLEFSSEAQAPFDRYYAVYSVQVKNGRSGIQVGKPQLVATSLANFVELGAWMNSHIVTFYSNNTIYALDILTGSITTITQTTAYARSITVVGPGQP
jgi:hypothetical protein